MLGAILVALVGGAGIAAQRARSAGIARDFARRLPPGTGGIIPGAGEIRLDGDRDRAVLLIHGFSDTPQTLRYVADALHHAGYTVHAPLLPGHGSTLDAFGRTRAKDWMAAVRDAYGALRATHGSVAVVGLSMGGALAIILAAGLRDLPALVLVAPYVSMPTHARVVARFHQPWRLIQPYFRSGGERSIHDLEERKRSLAYGVLTPRAVFELSRVVRRVKVSLPRVSAPTLVIHGRNDERVPPAVALREYARLGAPHKELVWMEDGGHILTVDVGRTRVIELVRGWVDRHMPAPARDGSRQGS